MLRHGKTTILLITADRLVRADLRRGRVSRIWQQTRPVVDNLPSLVEAAIRMGPKPGRRVWVLSSEFWTQTLPLAAETTTGMSDEQLRSALSFEAEPFSSISAFDSSIGHVALPGNGQQRQYWLTQVPRSELEQVEFVVTRSGGRLAGVCHPAGLPRPLGNPAGHGSWQRIELWSDVVVCLHCGPGGGPLRIHVINSAPHQNRWQDDAESWLTEVGNVELQETETLVGVVSGRVSGLERFGDHHISLEDETALASWLAAWAEQLRATTPEVPLIRAARRPVSTNTRIAIAALLTFVTVVLCGGHWLLVNAGTAVKQAELAEAQRPVEELKKLKEKIDELQKQQGTLRQESSKLGADLARCKAAVASQRQRMARLLGVLAKNAGSGLVIDRIDAEDGRMRVRGVCRRPRQANQLVRAMDQELSQLGLRASLPDKEAQYLLADGGPFAFEIVIQDVADATSY